MARPEKKRTLIIGLDGASWDIINFLASRRELPVLSEIISNGTSSSLESSIPYLTSPAWRCFSTGKNPGKLGVYSFNYISEDKKLRIVNANSFKSKDLWDYFSFRELSSCIVNMPMTYPPKPIKGVIVSGIPAFTHLNYTYPVNIKEILTRKLNYNINPKKVLPNLESISKEINQRFEAVKVLLESQGDFDLVMTTIFCIDNIAHEHWHGGNWDDILFESWRIIDRGIGGLIKDLGNNTNIIILSDHGMTTIRGTFYINQWLYERNLISFYEKNNKNSLIFSITKIIKLNKSHLDKIYRLSQKLKLIRILTIILGNDKLESFAESFAHRLEKNNVKYITTDIDVKNSNAFCLANGIYVDENNKEIINEIMNQLKKIKFPGSEETVFESIKKREEVYHGPYLNDAPDLILIPREGYKLAQQVNENNEIFSKDFENWEGDHKLEGIFMAYGPDIKKGQKIENAKIYDLAPTILHMFGLPIPNDMDGRVLTEIFEEYSELAKRKPEYVDPSYYDNQDKKQEVKSKIRKLKKETKL